MKARGGILAAAALLAASATATARAASVYVPNRGSNNVSQYDIGPTGTLTSRTPATVPTGAASAFHAALSPSGDSLYVVSHDAPATVAQFDVGTSGSLVLKSPPSVSVAANPFDLVVRP